MRRENRRGFTDKIYLCNFIAVNIIVAAIIILTAASGKLGITDMTALASVPACAYAELAIHSAVVAKKNERENLQKLKNAEHVLRIE